MAYLNALIAQGAQFRVPPPVDPMENMPQLMQMRASQNQNELAQYQLSSARREDASTNALNTAYQNAYDPATGKIDSTRLLQSLASSGAGSKIPGVQKSLTDAEIAQLQRQKLQGEVNALPGAAAYKVAQTTKLTSETKRDELKRAISDISNFNNAADALQNLDIHERDGKISPEKAAQMRAVLSDPNLSFSKWQRSTVMGLMDEKDRVEATRPKPVATQLGNRVVYQDMNPDSPTFKQEILPEQKMGATPSTAAALENAAAATSRARTDEARLKQSADQFNRRLEQETAAGDLTPETRDFAANLVAQGGAMPNLGMGKAAAKMRSEILSRAAQIATEGSGSAAGGAADVLANKAGLTGRAAEERVLGAQGANVALASSEARKMIELAKGYSDAIDRTQYPSINAIQNAVNKGTGDKNIVALNTALNSLVNSYARAINPRGVATVSDKNHAREIVNANYANGQLDTIFSVMDEEMKAAQESTGAARAALREKPAAAAASSAVKPSLKEIFR